MSQHHAKRMESCMLSASREERKSFTLSSPQGYSPLQHLGATGRFTWGAWMGDSTLWTRRPETGGGLFLLKVISCWGRRRLTGLDGSTLAIVTGSCMP